jgi:hypothetical protein
VPLCSMPIWRRKTSRTCSDECSFRGCKAKKALRAVVVFWNWY